MQERERDYIARATAYDGLVRAFAIEATTVVEALHERHDTYPVTTAALGRLAMGALLFGAMLKEGDHVVTLRIQGDGPAGTLLATANGRGEVRGLVSNPRPEIDQVRDGKLFVRGAVGTAGRLTVTRDVGMRHPYTSTVELVSGEIGEDLAYYLAHSEQVPSAVGIGVFVRADGRVEAAGGYVVQLMPGLAEDAVDEIEDKIRSLPHPTAMLRSGDSPEDMLGRIFPDGYELLDRLPVRFHCPCSRERAERALLLLGTDALEEMRAEGAARGHTEAVCQFCSTEYRFTTEEIESLIDQLKAA
ncbi:MAG: Hsp33 family molecular chaperone HslO [Gemmatimonadetes bacterium]|nr:Hsp33 family molecular chaperone HslO [Gemmatimonadota bacterium]